MATTDDLDTETADVLESLASLPTIAHPTISPDGSEIAFYYDETGRNELHVLDAETGALKQWSDGDVPRNARWFLRWGADGERVFFHQDEGGDEQNDIYALSRAGEVESVVEIDGQAVLNDVSDDGESLLFTSNRDGQMNAYRYDCATEEVTKLTDYERAVGALSFSPDGDRIAYATNETDDFDNVDVYVANADGSEPRNLSLGDVGAESAPMDWGPDGERLLVTDNTTDLSRAGVVDLAALDEVALEADDDTESDAGDTDARTAADDAVTWYSDSDFEESPTGFLPDGDRFFALRDRAAQSIPVVYDIETGESRELDVPEGMTSVGRMGPSDVAIDENRLLLQHTSPTSRPELLVYDLATDEYETLLEAEYGPFSPEDFADAEYLTVQSDGVPETPAEAVEHEPADELEIGALLYDSGERPSPLLVKVHGGPRARDTKGFNLYTQMLVMQGFSVLEVNYRGSTGRGREFVEELLEDWGGAEQGDVATAAEHVLETRDWLDEDRVVVFGGSYGGYSAYWQTVQYPDLYDAGIAWIGLTDLEEQYETTMPHYRIELMEKYLGTPEENPALYEERSPITHAENLAAPLLMVHGVNDTRVPVSQARRYREALESLGYEFGPGGDVEYEELGEEGHASTDQRQQLRTFELLADFLQRRAGNEPADAAEHAAED
ncbi:S9 family peptidase [Natrialba sp. SSL1]|uniref:S9 family peptidase n=1 Tax=Natrialba sp. SSL1 TaxID=1869245 RepID=UPI0008F8225A|nr:prolyl oligopeptidase family serine peptidase [Natrialba sp. SSL1]OIB56651.1 peptidase S9 [Natrialba sp. SSL1]